MILLRKKIRRGKCNFYQERAIIRVAKATQAKFIVSKLIAQRLQIDVNTEALMFGIKNKKLHVFKEPKDVDNYHLGAGDAGTYRFRSVELYRFLTDFFKQSKEKEFYLEMNNEDLTFKLIHIS